MMHQKKFLPLLSAMLMLSVAAGCSSPEYHRLMARTIAPATQNQLADERRSFLATPRARPASEGTVCSGDRSPQTHSALADVSIPAIHMSGSIERAVNPVVA